MGALAIDYQGERVRTWLYLVSQTDRFTAPLRPYLLRAGVPVPKAPSGERNVTQPWEYANVDDAGALLRAEVDVADNITVFGGVGGSYTGVERFFASAPTITNLRGDTTTSPQYYGMNIDRFSGEAGIRAKFDTGFVHHAVTLQGSYYQEETSRRLSAASGTYLSNIYNPVRVQALLPTVVASRPRLSDSTLAGFTAADTMSVLDERILLTAGVRQQSIEAHNYVSNVGTLASSYDKSATSPFAGLVVRPFEHVSLYANYIEGLSRGDVAPSTAINSGTVLAPYVSRQVETGLKVDFGRIGATLGLFQITRPMGELSPQRVFSDTGEQRVRGLELSVYGEITPELRLLGGMTLLDGVLTKTASAANLGHKPIGVPQTQFNIGAEWDLPWLGGLTLNGAVVVTGRQFIDAANTQALPDWARLDLGLRYTTTIADKKTVFRANVFNVTGTRYWTGVASFGTFFQGAPRTYLLSMSIDL